MRAARQDGLPGGAAGASLALHLGAGLWLALGGAVPGGPPAREVPVEVAFLPHAAAGAVVPPEPEAVLEEEIASPIDAPQLAEPGPLTTPLPVPPPLAESPTQPSEAPQPEASAAPSPVTESLAPEPLLIAAAPEPMAELPSVVESRVPAPEPLPIAAAPGPALPLPAERPTEPRRVEAAPKPAATPRRPVQPTAARAATREASAQPMQGSAAIPVAAAITPGPPPLITQARYRHPPTPPAYPPRAIAFRMAGTALIRALVGPDGQTRELRLHRSSGFAELDQAAMAAVRGWAFAAATEGGRPIEAWVEVPVRFRLDD